MKSTSSAKAGITKRLTWIAKSYSFARHKVIVHTDSTSCSRITRKARRFEKSAYRTKKQGDHKPCSSWEFYKLTDQINYEIVKVKGHQVSNQKNHIDKLYPC
ncbi:MAG: hypothetical protein R2764_04670 [Bacteroidales bacterium]